MKRYPWNNEKIRVLFLDAHTYDELSTSAKKLYDEYLEKKEKLHSGYGTGERNHFRRAGGNFALLDRKR